MKQTSIRIKQYSKADNWTICYSVGLQVEGTSQESSPHALHFTCTKTHWLAICCCEASLLLQCSLKISSTSRGCKSSCCSLFYTLYLGKINFNRMHWFELIINGSSKLMKEGCVHTRQYICFPLFLCLFELPAPKEQIFCLMGLAAP